MNLEEIKWDRDWFSKVPRSYWKSMGNRRKFLEDFAIKLNIKNASDWGKVTYRQISEEGGAGLLVQYYKGSLFNCLQSVYKGIPTILLLI